MAADRSIRTVDGIGSPRESDGVVVERPRRGRFTVAAISRPAPRGSANVRPMHIDHVASCSIPDGADKGDPLTQVSDRRDVLDDEVSVCFPPHRGPAVVWLCEPRKLLCHRLDDGGVEWTGDPEALSNHERLGLEESHGAPVIETHCGPRPQLRPEVGPALQAA